MDDDVTDGDEFDATGRKQLPPEGPTLEVGEGTLAGVAALMSKFEPILEAGRHADGRMDWAVVELEARQRGERLRDELLRGMKDYDTFDILSNILLFNLPADPNTYRESEHPGRLVNVEYAAALLVSRPRRANANAHRLPAEVGSRMREWNEQITDLLNLRGLQQMAGLRHAEPDLAQASYQQFQLELTVRNPCYDFQEESHLVGLFGAEAVGDHLREILGVSIGQCISMIRLCEQRIGHALTAGANAGLAEARSALAQTTSPDGVRPTGMAEQFVDRLAEVSPDEHDLAARAYAMWAAWNELGDRAAFTAEDLAESAGVDTAAAESFLELFAISLGTSVHQDPVRALQDIKRRPILRDDGEYLSLGGGDLLFAARDALESAIKSTNQAAWQRYERHRSGWAVARASSLFAKVLDPDVLETEVKWRTGEQGYEMDLLIVVDRTAITVEVKAGAFTEPARRAAPHRLRRDLERLVSDAHTQATRAAEAIRSGVELRNAIGDVVPLAPDRITSIVPVVVTLDELVAIAPQAWALARSGFLDHERTPTTMALTDLELVVDILDSPSRLLHYLSRRARMNDKGGLVAHEEADLVMYYLRQGLYLEETPEHVTQILDSETDDLDAYYYHRYGPREAPAEKPTPRLHPELQEIIEVLEEHRPEAWTLTALLLLDMSEDTQNSLGDHIRELKESSRTEGAKRDLTMAIDQSTRGLTVATAGDGDPRSLAARAEFLGAKNKYMLRADTWTVLGVDVSEDDRVGFFHRVLDDPWQQDDAMDALAEETRRRIDDGTIGGW